MTKQWHLLLLLAASLSVQALADSAPDQTPDEVLPVIQNPFVHWNVASDKPDYSKRTYIFDRVELRPYPRVYYADSSKSEFMVPFSTKGKSEEVAQKLRAAWQRLEDRYYYRALAELNGVAGQFAMCLLGDFGQGLNTAKPTAFTATLDNMIPAILRGKIPEKAPDPMLYLDQYGLLPQVPNSDYCDDFKPESGLLFTPGTCTYDGITGAKLFCVQGDTPTLNPLAPRPLTFDWAGANRRILKAVKRAETSYQLQYHKDALKALAPAAGFFPMPWDTLATGAFVAPVMSLPNPVGITNVAKEARRNLDGLFKYTAYEYYAQGLTMNQSTNLLKLHTLPLRTDVLGPGNPPGVWKFEEYKRRFPVNDPVTYERFGFVNNFEAWNSYGALLLPEKVEAKPLRQMIYLAAGINIYIYPVPPFVVPVPVPAPVLIPQYAAGLPYVGAQTKFGWMSIAEGYTVPLVNGTPIVDYKGDAALK